ncbi:MAG: NYN domain-containing protein [Dehalococcoidia bacterium]|nr:NYN domain-containing protein [Dehalococcoidia bacterium]
MALNIFPRREKPAAPAAEPTPPPPPEPSSEVLEDPRPRRRRSSRRSAAEQPAATATQQRADAAAAEPTAPAPAAVEPPAQEAAPAARRRRSRVATIVEEPAAAPAAAPEPPAPALVTVTAPARVVRRAGQLQRAAEPEQAGPPAEPAAVPAARKDRTPAPLPAEKQLAQLAHEVSALTRTLEAQAAQLAQLVRVQEDLARRVAHAPGATAAPAPRIGVFVDAANIELALDRLKHRVNWKKMLDYLSEGRQLVRAVAYSPVHEDPGVSIETQRFAEPFIDQGFRVVRKPFKRFSDGTIKANVDIEMALDIMEMLDRLDVVVLVSGDGDFERLVEVVQAKGVRVEVVSVGGSTASNLRHAADRFIDIQAILPKVRA